MILITFIIRIEFFVAVTWQIFELIRNNTFSYRYVKGQNEHFYG